MIHLNRITSSQIKTGVTIILSIMLSCIQIQAQSLEVDQLFSLAKEYETSNEHYLSYSYYKSYYLLSENVEKKYLAGIRALTIALEQNRLNEANNLLADLNSVYPDSANRNEYYYGYYYLSANLFFNADASLKLEDLNSKEDRVKFLRAYSFFNQNQPQRCRKLLTQISSEFKYYDEIQHIINVLGNVSIDEKSTILSVFFSSLIPGAGQIYTGFLFDGLTNIGFNVLFGSAAYSTLRYEMTKEIDDRNYILPAITGAAYSLFYLTNLYNSANSAKTANKHLESLFYGSVLNELNMIFNDTAFFLSDRSLRE